MPELSTGSPNELYELGMDRVLSEANPASLYAVGDDGSRRRLPLRRWLAGASEQEERLLDRVAGPVLDVGCGAGRHLSALRERGIEATGIDVSAYAVSVARQSQATVVHGSVFDLSLDDGWETALLLDGNVGIGGEPGRLLTRTAELLTKSGQVLVELEPPPLQTRIVQLRLEGPGQISDWFTWAWVGTDRIESIAAGAGLEVTDLWSMGDRCFVRLQRDFTV